MTRPILLAAAALAAAALAPAAASANGVGGVPAATQSQMALPTPGDAQYRVPAGKVEHRVSIVAVSGTKAVASRERQELWLSANRSRMVVTNAATGKLRVEIVDRPGETRIYDAQKRRVTVSRTSSTTPAYTSSAFESALHRAYVQQGVMRVAGERTVDGHRLLLLESVPGSGRAATRARARPHSWTRRATRSPRRRRSSTAGCSSRP